MKRLIVYAGANGSGKSSLRDDAAYPVDTDIDPDRIARQIHPENPRSADVAAGREALRLFDLALREGRSVSFETTLADRTVLGRMQAARNAGYEITLLYILLDDVEENVRRVEQRAAGGQHWIEPEAVRRRALGSLANLPAAIALADRALVLDNSGRIHRQLLKVEGHRIVFAASGEIPRQLLGMLPRIAGALASDD